MDPARCHCLLLHALISLSRFLTPSPPALQVPPCTTRPALQSRAALVAGKNSAAQEVIDTPQGRLQCPNAVQSSSLSMPSSSPPSIHRSPDALSCTSRWASWAAASSTAFWSASFGSPVRPAASLPASGSASICALLPAHQRGHHRRRQRRPAGRVRESAASRAIDSGVTLNPNWSA